MSFLAGLRTKPKNKKPVILLYSRPGCGKTSLAAQFPKCVFMVDSTEDGITDLQSHGLIDENIPSQKVMNWQEANDGIDELLNSDHDFKYLVIDSLSGLVAYLNENVAAEKFDGDMVRFHNFGKGAEAAATPLNEFMKKLERLREEKDMGIILLGHSAIRKFTDPQRASYDKIVLDIHEKLESVVMKYATTVGYLEFVIETIKDVDKKLKAKGGTERQLNLTQTAVFEAKNRWGITDPINMGSSANEAFVNLQQAIKESRESRKSATAA